MHTILYVYSIYMLSVVRGFAPILSFQDQYISDDLRCAGNIIKHHTTGATGVINKTRDPIKLNFNNFNFNRIILQQIWLNSNLNIDGCP